MTSNEYTIHYKTSLLEYAWKFNVSLACRTFRISRTRYYEIAHDFEKYGKAGLLFSWNHKGNRQYIFSGSHRLQLKLCFCKAI